MYNAQYNCKSSMYSSRIKDNEKDVILEIPVPGFDKEDINIKVQEENLILKGKTEEFDFEKVYQINDKIDVENIGAEISKGILKVTLPKNAPTYREITIN